MKAHQVPRIYDMQIRPNQYWTGWRASLHVWELGPNGGFHIMSAKLELGEEFRDPASAAAALGELMPKEGGQP